MVLLAAGSADVISTMGNWRDPENVDDETLRLPVFSGFSTNQS